MAEKMREDRGLSGAFPSTDFWEELVERWEDFAPADALGEDYAGRIFTIEAAVKSKLLPAEAAQSVVSREQIEEALEPLNCEDPSSLIEELWTLAGRHLRPVHRKWLGSDPASTRRQLRTVIKAVVALQNAIDPLPPVTVDFLEECHARLPVSHRSREAIGLGDLEKALTDIGYAAYFADLALMRGKKQPPKLMRARALREAAQIIEKATGAVIRTSWSRADQKRFAFEGPAGRALRNYMKLIEPKASERALVTELLALRKGTGAPA